ncbi:hypothetical protein SY27_03695 [Flavobacterium sp. 316]|uniref:hypothetical protein n=1 Tax=Flavobacterium sp. 316 TaxID=1603293 RepID=UPI0005E781E3|nr:hypothetical protein [Flavobacterium sp. 316]KIX21805.1 hypothetical protein SY27_03695 [Flavobacterium sp. 316]
MKKTILILFLFTLNILTIPAVNGQNTRLKSKYSQRDFEINKIHDQTYNLWQYKNRFISKKNDTLPHSYFVDDRNYKGLINYGVSFRSKDFRNFHFSENLHMFFLKVDFEKVLFNPNDSIIEIEGYISGGWDNLAKKKQTENSVENRIDVFLGEITDTIKNCYYSKIVNEEAIEVKLNNSKVDETTILDTFPAFYFKNYSYYRTSLRGRRSFKIKGKITNNTLLAFGEKNCYSEIFDLSAMVYSPKKNKRKKIKKRENSAYRTIMINNELVADIEKQKAKNKEINYYTYTEKAEDYILKRQYAKAKEQYLLLDKEYPLLFARDLHNAVRCAVLSRDYKNAFYFGEKLAKKGVDIKYFNTSVLNPLKRNPSWNNFTVRYDSIYKESLEKFNTNLKTQIEALKDEDQADYGLTNRKEPKVLYETTERVTNKLIELLKKEGYPSEEKTGIYTKNDTVINPFPEYHVLIKHATQQKAKNLETLNKLLEKSIKNFEYDSKRSTNNVFYHNSCFHIYKGNLYISKSCGSNEIMVRKMKFIFNNPYGFFIHNDNYIVTEYNKENPEEYDKYYKENYNFVMKLTDDWFFYEK